MKLESIKVIIGREKVVKVTKTTTTESTTPVCPSLTKVQRMYGFAACFILGYIISFGSTFALLIGTDNGKRFGITYSLGNIIALCGSGFLVGPMQQIKLMFKPVRRIASIIYLTLIFVVLMLAFVVPKAGPIILLLVGIQCMAAIWYSASYIPYGRKAIVKICKKLFDITLE